MAVSLEDKMALLEIEARFDWEIDTQDIDGWVSHFAADGVFEASYGTARGSAELHAFMEKIERSFSEGKRHVSGNHYIEGSGDDAVLHGYLIVFDRQNEARVVATGVYVNTYRRIAGEWKVVHRRLDIDPTWQNAKQ